MKHFIFTLFILFLNMNSARADTVKSLIVATEIGNVDFLLDQIHTSLDLDAVDSNGNTALMKAAASGNLDTVKLLVSSGASIDKVTKGGAEGKKCALTCAFRHRDILEFLIESGADINIKLNQGKTPLHYASESYENYSLMAVSIFLKYGADPNITDLYGRTPLHFAVKDKSKMITLLDCGADLNIRDHEGWKPLHRAYETGSIDILRELTKRGASLNEFKPNGTDALHSVIGLEGIKFLVEEHGLDINRPMLWHDGKSGAPNFFMNCLNRQKALDDDFEILDYLISRGADVNAEVFYQYEGIGKKILFNVLSWSIQVAKAPKYVIDWLIRHGAK